jgi:regulator of CtrA degradation
VSARLTGVHFSNPGRRSEYMMSIQEQVTNTPVRLAERRIFSDRFKPLYSDGMRLVEEAAAYLDGEGRTEAKKLSRIPATLYAAESMRLTTRLMQIASWLLLQRAANNGEMSRAQVADEKSKVQLETPSASRSTQSWDELPLKFIGIVERSLQMQTMVKRFDEALYPKAGSAQSAEPKRNAVNDQMNLLQAAFGGR